MRKWKRNLKVIGSNPDYIELNIKAIQKELKKEQPDTSYLSSKISNIKLWLSEIDLANQRASNVRLRRVV